MKRTIYILLAMLLGAALPSCINREESTPWKDLSEQDQERYFVNTFGYNMMATYYLWCDEVKEGLRKWGAKADPVETVRNLRYKEDGKEVDRWSMMTDDYQSFYDMLQGNSKTMGIELSMYYADETKQDFDEILLEHGSNGVIWLHFAVRPQGNRRRINFLKA